MKISKPKILFLPKWYPNRLDAFDGNFIENHARAIAVLCDIAIIFVHSENQISADGKYELIESDPFGYPEIRVYFKSPSFTFLGVETVVKAYRYFKAQLKAYTYYIEKYKSPDLVHVHVLTRSAFLALYLWKLKKIPFIISEHWSGYFPQNGAYKGFLKKAFTKYVVKNAKAITTVSEYLAKAMKKHELNSHYEIIPNVVATEIFKPKNKDDKKFFKLIHASILDIIPKNLPAVLEVIKKISEYRNDRTILEQNVKELGIGKFVKFHGNVSQQEVADAMAEADMFVLFSLYENQPCVIIEAFSAGIPVIAPNTGGIPEHFNNQTGTLVEVNNKDQLEKAITDMMDNLNSFSSSYLHNFSKERFSEQKIGKQFLDLYLKVLNKKLN